MRLIALAPLLLLLVAVSACSAPATTPSPTTAPVASVSAPSPLPSPSAAASNAGVASNAEAIQELQATRGLYQQAQQAFTSGDKAKALDLMNSAYLDHFERVEPWLDAHVSQDYRESVESAISRDLRRKLRDGTGTDAEINAQFPVALQKLTEAQQRLGGS